MSEEPDIEETRRSSLPLKNQRGKQFFKLFSLLVSGFGVGWLIGLSATPILQIVIAGILTVVVGVTSVLAGIEAPSTTPENEGDVDTLEPQRSRRRNERRNVSPVPLALCILGIAVGASLGVYGRTHEWLGADPSRLAEKWAGTGLTSQAIDRRVFDQVYPPAASTEGKTDNTKTESKSEKAELNEAAGKNQSHQGSLFSSVSAGECTEFGSASGSDLRRLMLASSDVHVREFTHQCNSDAALKVAVEDLICSDYH